MNINLEYSFIRHIPMKNIILFAAAIMMISCASNQRMTLSCLDRNDFDTIVNNQKIALFRLKPKTRCIDFEGSVKFVT